MNTQIYQYEIVPRIDIAEVEATLTLSLLATESLHGEARVRLEAHYAFDAEKRTCLIDAADEVGQDLNWLFLGFLRREFGETSFRVKRSAAREELLATSAA